MPLIFPLLLQFLFQERALKVLELNVDPKRQTIDIKAGTDGIWGWLMRAFGIDTESGFSFNVTGCRRTVHGLFNSSRTFAPLPNVSAAVYLLVKPLWALVVGVFFSLYSIRYGWYGFARGFDVISLTFAAVTGIIAAVLFLKFFLGERTAVIGVMTNAATVVSIKLKIKATEYRTLQQAIAIIETVISRNSGNPSSQHEADASLHPADLRGASKGNHEIDQLEDLDDLEEDTDEDDWDQNGHDDHRNDVRSDRNTSHRSASAKGNRMEKRDLNCPHCDVRLRLNESIIGSRIRCPACQKPFVAH